MLFFWDFQHLSTNFLIYTAHMTIKYPSVVVFLYKTYNVILKKSRAISKHITYERMRSRQKHWTRRFLLKMKQTEMRRRRWHVWEGNRPLNANILSPGRLYLFLDKLIFYLFHMSFSNIRVGCIISYDFNILNSSKYSPIYIV